MPLAQKRSSEREKKHFYLRRETTLGLAVNAILNHRVAVGDDTGDDSGGSKIDRPGYAPKSKCQHAFK
jgi:hypothetical protein